MARSKLFRVSAFVLLLMLAVVACGQKPGVHVADGFAEGPLDVGGGDGGVDGPGPDGGGDGPSEVPGGNGDSGGGDSGGGDNGGGDNGGGVAGDRTGITDTEIIIGLHAPLTGAAPIEPKAFSVGKDLYWRWLKEVKKEKVLGRDVRVVFRDDQYTPSTAVNVCNQMATQDRAFLLIGGAGTDQINACANYAEPRSIPYFSPGVQEKGLTGKKAYFAVTMTYAAQMPLLANLLKKENTGNRFNKYGLGNEVLVGHVRPNTPNFNDADDALKDAAKKAGFGYKTYTVVKEGSSSEAQTVAAQMQQDGVDIVVPITAPTFTTQLAIQTGKNQYKPLYAGVGISNNINQMINQACRNQEFQDALFLSPWPGWKNLMAGEFDKDFRDAATRFASDVNTRDKGGDILVALWGIMKNLHAMFEAAGPNTTRQSFLTMMNSFSYKTTVFPDLKYTASDHFGAQNVHALIGKCDEQGDGQHVSRGPQFISHPKYKGLRSNF